jgi:hypothetical protein
VAFEAIRGALGMRREIGIFFPGFGHRSVLSGTNERPYGVRTKMFTNWLTIPMAIAGDASSSVARRYVATTIRADVSPIG